MVLLMRENIERNHSCLIPFFAYLLSHHFMLANIPLSGRIYTPLSWPAASFTYTCGCMHAPLSATHYITKMTKNSTTTGCFLLIALPIVVFTMFASLLTAVMVDLMSVLTVNCVLDNIRIFLETIFEHFSHQKFTTIHLISPSLLGYFHFSCPGGLPFHSE